MELEDSARQTGFTVVAALAAVAEHPLPGSLPPDGPTSWTRPNCGNLPGKSGEKVSSGDLSRPELPGNRPYKPRGGGGMVPHPGPDCVQCGRCAQVCPVGAINPADAREVDAGTCISCMRCVEALSPWGQGAPRAAAGRPGENG